MDIIFEARNIRYRYSGNNEVIKGISFHIRRGEKIALVGPNGAGKSTLLQMFNGIIKPSSGQLLYDNELIKYDRSSLRDLRKKVGFVMQNPDRQIIAPTVFQDIAFGPANLGFDDSEVKQAVSLALKQVGLDGFDRRPPHNLSGGEKKRVAIAGVLAMNPDMLVFDEPTSGLDPSGSEDLMDLLEELNQNGKTIIISTHDVELAYPWADRAILLLDGGILKEDIPEMAFGDPALVRKAHLTVPILLELSSELEKHGYLNSKCRPFNVLEMLGIITSIISHTNKSRNLGVISVYEVNTENASFISEWLGHNCKISVGAMGTRAKLFATRHQLELEFTYGVIDKCILRSLRGLDSLILTSGGMSERVFDRVTVYCNESNNQIQVKLLNNSGADIGRFVN